MSTIIKVMEITALIGVGYLVYRNRHGIRRRFRYFLTKKSSSDSRRYSLQNAIDAFLPFANNFDGVYEPLFKGARGQQRRERMLNTINQWKIRMQKPVGTSADLDAWWKTVVEDVDCLQDEALQQRMKDILDFIGQAGIVRDNHDVFIATDDTMMFYQCADEQQILPGASLQVESPCWYLHTTPPRIVEKGFCIIQPQQS